MLSLSVLYIDFCNVSRYIERMAFLDRADQRQFEQERDLRLRTGKRWYRLHVGRTYTTIPLQTAWNTPIHYTMKYSTLSLHYLCTQWVFIYNLVVVGRDIWVRTLELFWKARKMQIQGSRLTVVSGDVNLVVYHFLFIQYWHVI